ncbi:hypothetical protein LXL04_001763 [Taraxacum kok-saghyz]
MINKNIDQKVGEFSNWIKCVQGLDSEYVRRDKKVSLSSNKLKKSVKKGENQSKLEAERIKLRANIRDDNPSSNFRQNQNESKYIVRIVIPVKTKRHRDLHGKPKSGKTTGSGSREPIHYILGMLQRLERDYKKERATWWKYFGLGFNQNN